jgi:hypothetical protein
VDAFVILVMKSSALDWIEGLIAFITCVCIGLFLMSESYKPVAAPEAPQQVAAVV